MTKNDQNKRKFIIKTNKKKTKKNRIKLEEKKQKISGIIIFVKHATIIRKNILKINQK